MANDGEVATYNIQELGPHNGPIVHGLHIYSTNSTGKLAFLKNMVGIEEYDFDYYPSVLVKQSAATRFINDKGADYKEMWFLES
jgi:hypothetical protein